MNRFLIALLISTVAVSGLMAQAQNDADFSMTLNGVTGTGPLNVDIIKPGTLDIQFDGNPNKPFLVISGLSINVGDQIIGPISVDLANVDVVMDGVSPASFIDFLANTGATGTTNFTFPIHAGLPTGFYAGLQSVVVDFTLPLMVADSAATGITLLAPVDFGTVDFARGSGTSNSDSFSQSFGMPPVNSASPSSDYDIELINLNNFPQALSDTSSPGAPNYQFDPGLVGPISWSANSSYEHVRTIFGDVYHFEDNTTATNEWGYFMYSGGGLAPVEIPGTRMQNGTSSSSPWESQVSVSADQTTMAAVFDPTGSNDQVFLIKLDGTVFASTGTAVMDVTPASAPVTISEDSMQFAGGAFYFTDSTSTGNLFRCAKDGSTGIATLVALPPLGTTFPAFIVDNELFYHAPTDSIFLQAGNATTHEDIYRITGATAATETITNITNHAVATEIEEFGDAYDGFDGQFSVSPSGGMIAYIQFAGGDDELFVCDTTGAGVPFHITPDAMFEIGIDDVNDLNMYSDDGVIFFAGTSTSLMDVYHWQISTGTLLNLTQTNMQSGAVLPILGTPTAGIDGDGYFTTADRMIFGRDNTLTLGPSAGTTGSWNLVGIEYATLTVYNVTGDEFPGPTSTNMAEFSFTGLELTLSPGGTFAWFKGAVLGGASTSNEDLWSVDVGSNGQALAHGIVSSGRSIDNIAPGPTSLDCLFSSEDTADEEVFQAFALAAGATQLTDDGLAGSDIFDGSLHYFGTTAPSPGFFYAQGTNSTSSPSDSVLNVFDFGSMLSTGVDATLGTYHIFGVSYP